MFKYPAQSKAVCRPGNYPRSVEQNCVKCCNWFVVSQADVRRAMDVWSATSDGHGYPFQHCSCPRCGEAQILVMVGKYDPPFARSRARCAVQYWTWESEKLVSKGARL